MNRLIKRLLHPPSQAARDRLARMQAFVEIRDRLDTFQNGRIFNVDTTHLRNKRPALYVTERASSRTLRFAHAIATVVMTCDRTFTIIIHKNKLTYVIY